MRITIIGVGLLGGSFGMAVRKAGAAESVAGVDLDRAVLDRALERGAIDGGYLETAEGVEGADLVVLATPVRSILDMVPRLAPLLGEETILLDLGSTKEAIVSSVAGEAGIRRYVGGHPMAGTEHTGIDHANDGLFQDATFALVPPPSVDEGALDLLRDLVRRIGARPVVIPAERHDWIVSVTSHLPYLLSVVLALAAEQAAREEERLGEFAASGFRDTTRLAASTVQVMADICLTNGRPLLRGIEDARRLLDELAAQIEAGRESELVKTLTKAKESRAALLGERRTD
ncbi:MAG: prephenate dehydrogenase [Gemmatimonadetes bacterium]|nr:prephenate dehydrogenase [Gemmatimonadota bacterium]